MKRILTIIISIFSLGLTGTASAEWLTGAKIDVLGVDQEPDRIFIHIAGNTLVNPANCSNDHHGWLELKHGDKGEKALSVLITAYTLRNFVDIWVDENQCSVDQFPIAEQVNIFNPVTP